MKIPPQRREHNETTTNKIHEIERRDRANFCFSDFGKKPPVDQPMIPENAYDKEYCPPLPPSRTKTKGHQRKLSEKLQRQRNPYRNQSSEGETERRELHQHKNQGIAATAKGAQEQQRAFNRQTVGCLLFSVLAVYRLRAQT